MAFFPERLRGCVSDRACAATSSRRITRCFTGFSLRPESSRFSVAGTVVVGPIRPFPWDVWGIDCHRDVRETRGGDPAGWLRRPPSVISRHDRTSPAGDAFREFRGQVAAAAFVSFVYSVFCQASRFARNVVQSSGSIRPIRAICAIRGSDLSSFATFARLRALRG